MFYFLMNQLKGVYKIMGYVLPYSHIDSVLVVSNLKCSIFTSDMLYNLHSIITIVWKYISYVYHSLWYFDSLKMIP